MLTAPRWSTYVGLFFVTMATITYEILLTRIFSVIFWYHFAFVAISIAMFGMSVGAAVVYVRPRFFLPSKTVAHLAISAVLFSLTMLGAYLVQRNIVADLGDRSGYVALCVIYVIVAVPFVFSGICVCLALTRYPAQTSALYAADLVGAAVGCLCIIALLHFMDGPSAVAATAAIAALGALLFALADSPRIILSASLALVVMVAVAGASNYATRNGKPFMGIKYTKGMLEKEVLYQKWNHFSRLTVSPAHELPFGWGLSSKYAPERPPRQEYELRMDAAAGTPMTNFDGDLKDIEHMKYDVVNSVHYLRSDADVLVIGTGGGRDVLSALAFKQKSILGVEINGDILRTVNEKYGDFTGHLDHYPNVTFVNDEARSYVARQDRKFDIIQVSLIDTFAASSAGAFVLTENSLYTTNAWKMFLSKLSDRGIVTFSRWYFPQRPAEIYRLTMLASKSLLEAGISDPRSHIILLETQSRIKGFARSAGIGTILVSKQPFSKEDIDAANRLANDMAFTVMLSPVSATDPMLAQIASGQNLDGIADAYPLNIHAPTDDQPFFFNVMYLHSLFHFGLTRQGNMTANAIAVYVLGWLAVIVIVLTALCIVIPLALTTDRTLLQGSLPMLLYFGSIGLGFMMIEISQMQRLVVFLGHPTYALAVVLFSLLVFSGIGSLSSGRVAQGAGGLRRLALLMAVLAIFGIVTVGITAQLAAAITPIRIAVAVAMLAPLGFFMGMAFPLGMRWISENSPALGPWLWGINGATSVCASVLAMVIALAAGITASFWTGFAFYGLAAVAYAWATHAPAPLRNSVKTFESEKTFEVVRDLV